MAVDAISAVERGTVGAIGEGIEFLQREFGDYYGTGEMPLLSNAETDYMIPGAIGDKGWRTEVFLHASGDSLNSWRARMITRLVGVSPDTVRPVLMGAAAAYFVAEDSRIAVRHRELYPLTSTRRFQRFRPGRDSSSIARTHEIAALSSIQELKLLVTDRVEHLEIANHSVAQGAVSAPRYARLALVFAGLHRDDPSWRN